MRISYSVTFEFPTRAPVTHRGTVLASQVATCASRAIKEAQTILQPRNWSSMVFVALERMVEPGDTEELETPDETGTDE